MTPEKKLQALRVICLLITLILLIAGLWPFTFHPVNKVAWLTGGTGIRFYGQGIVKASPDFLGTMDDNGPLTIEFLIRPERERSYVASILTLLDRKGEETFLCSQWKSHLILRTRLKKSRDERERFYEWGLNGILHKNRTSFVTITAGPRGTVLYLDGMRKRTYAGNLLVPSTLRRPGNLLIGTSRTGEHYWVGSLLGLAIYERTLSGKEVLEHFHGWQALGQPVLSEERKAVALYLFDERGGNVIRDHTNGRSDLLLPKVFEPLHRTTLGMPSRDQWFSRWNLMDIAINILGFVPFGLVVSAWLRSGVMHASAGAVYLMTMLLGFCLSIGIELIQAYLPVRDSSWLDVISNTLGTVGGALFYKFYVTVLKSAWERVEHIFIT